MKKMSDGITKQTDNCTLKFFVNTKCYKCVNRKSILANGVVLCATK